MGEENKQSFKPRYCTLQYSSLKELNVSIAEYFYLDMVHQLSHQRWCIKSLDHIADDMNITKMGVFKMRNRLIEVGYIEKHKDGSVRTTEAYNKVILETDDRITKLYGPYNKVIPAVSQSYTKKDIRITEENKPQLTIERKYIPKPHKLSTVFDEATNTAIIV